MRKTQRKRRKLNFGALFRAFLAEAAVKALPRICLRSVYLRRISADTGGFGIEYTRRDRADYWSEAMA